LSTTDSADTPRLVTDNEVDERRRLVYTVLVLIGVFGALTSFNILYTNKEIRESDAIKCELFMALDDRYSALPSVDKDQRELIEIIRRLRNNLPCVPSGKPFPPLKPAPLPSAASPTPGD
jgi:hypothetical protein